MTMDHRFGIKGMRNDHRAVLAAVTLASALATTAHAAAAAAPAGDRAATLAGKRDKHRYDACARARRGCGVVAAASRRRSLLVRRQARRRHRRGARVRALGTGGDRRDRHRRRRVTSDALFHANNIPTAVDVVTDDGRKQRVALPGTIERVEVPLGGAPIKQLVITFASVKKGRMNDTCISGVRLHSATPLLVGINPADADALMPALAEIHRALHPLRRRADRRNISCSRCRCMTPCISSGRSKAPRRSPRPAAIRCASRRGARRWTIPILRQDEFVTRAPRQADGAG